MPAPEELKFLAALVHRGHLGHDQAARLAAAVESGRPLDDLLVGDAGWSPERVARLRRTDAGAIPEIPGYSIEGLLGRGGTADVFLATERKTGRRMALKVLRPEAARTPGVKAAFVRESKLLAELRHPGLVEGHGPLRFVPPGEEEVLFSRMECIDGRTLLQMLDEGAPFPEEDALRIVVVIAEVLAYLAEQRVIHRDVKPGNVMLDVAGRIKMIDLGFAAREGELNTAGTAVGTRAYVSPEQAQGGAAADLRSDVYSLGVTLFHLVVGRLPFESSSDTEVLRMQVTQALSSPELKGRGFSPHLAYFVQKMMAKEASIRYQSWPELIEDVQEQIAGRARLDFERDEGGAGRASGRTPRRRRS